MSCALHRTMRGGVLMTVAATAGVLLLACTAARPPAAVPERGLRCDHSRCPAPYSCRYRPVGGHLEGECRLEVGRCNSDLDCPPTSQRCQRFDVEPGVCVQH